MGPRFFVVAGGIGLIATAFTIQACGETEPAAEPADSGADVIVDSGQKETAPPVEEDAATCDRRLHEPDPGRVHRGRGVDLRPLPPVRSGEVQGADRRLQPGVLVPGARGDRPRLLPEEHVQPDRLRERLPRRRRQDAADRHRAPRLHQQRLQGRVRDRGVPADRRRRGRRRRRELITDRSARASRADRHRARRASSTGPAERSRAAAAAPGLRRRVVDARVIVRVARAVGVRTACVARRRAEVAPALPMEGLRALDGPPRQSAEGAVLPSFAVGVRPAVAEREAHVPLTSPDPAAADGRAASAVVVGGAIVVAAAPAAVPERAPTIRAFGALCIGRARVVVVRERVPGRSRPAASGALGAGGLGRAGLRRSCLVGGASRALVAARAAGRGRH